MNEAIDSLFVLFFFFTRRIFERLHYILTENFFFFDCAARIDQVLSFLGLEIFLEGISYRYIAWYEKKSFKVIRNNNVVIKNDNLSLSIIYIKIFLTTKEY